MTLSVPEPLPNDPEDLSTALETAAIFSAQGDVREAVRWVRRAAELAGDAGDDIRALALARAVADLGASVAPAAVNPPAAAPVPSAAASAPSAAAPVPSAAAPVPSAPEQVSSAVAPAVSPPPEAAPLLPPPPPLPDRSPAEALSNGDRITNPGIAPPSTPAQAAPEPAVGSGPASIPPPTAKEDAGWGEPEADPETPRPTNGAAEAHAAPAPAAAAPPVQAAPAPAPAVTPAAAPASHQAVRARVEPTTETGVFRLTLLAPGESAGPEAHEALLVLLDPAARLES